MEEAKVLSCADTAGAESNVLSEENITSAEEYCRSLTANLAEFQGRLATARSEKECARFLRDEACG